MRVSVVGIGLCCVVTWGKREGSLKWFYERPLLRS